MIKKLPFYNQSKKNKEKRFSELVSESTNGILKELGGHGIKESKLMVDNVVVFTNSSGGTGVSTVLSNVAYVMAKSMNMNILVIDLNIVCPTQHIYFDHNRYETKIRSDLVDYLTGQSSIGDATITNNSISIMYGINRSIADEINCEDAIAVGNLEELINKARELYDAVLIDCPMRISNSLCNTAMYMCDSIYTVWDEGIHSILNTEKIMRQLGFTGIDSFNKMKVIMNKKTSVKYSKIPFEKLGLTLIETLPFSTDVIYSSLDASIYCSSGKARNKNGAEFERAIISLTNKIAAIGGKTDTISKVGSDTQIIAEGVKEEIDEETTEE